MNIRSTIPCTQWLAFWLCLTTTPLANAALLSVSPSSTSNTFAGDITLQIGGLTNTEPVVVQEFLDANQNGVVDPGELLVDVFPISDGGVSIIGGQTNLNVPFDRNAAAGDITLTLPFSAQALVQNFVGHHVFRVVSTLDRFAPVEATFVVTNSQFLQLVTGQVFLGALPATNAIVVALRGSGGDGEYAGATLVDNTGYYALRLPTNDYVLLATKPDCYFDTAFAPQIALTNGMTATNDLNLTSGTVTISGSVRDATNNSPLGGLFLLLDSGDALSLAFTASNGTFSAAVGPSYWSFEIQSDRLSRRGYVTRRDLPQVNTTTGAVANVNLLLPKANAMFYGRFTNQLGAPFANLPFDASDGQNSPGTFEASGVTDPNGYYTVAVVGQTNQWFCGPETEMAPALTNHVLSQGQNVALTNGQAYRQDFVAVPATSRISGHVQDQAGNPVVGVSLASGAFIGGINYSPSHARTDTAGNYSLAAIAGQWGVHFTFGDGDDSLSGMGLVDLSGPYHQVTVPPDGVVNLTVYPVGAAALSAPERISANQVRLNANGLLFASYTLQVSTNLSTTNWVSLFSFQLTSNPFQIMDSQANTGQRFYRLFKN